MKGFLRSRVLLLRNSLKGGKEKDREIRNRLLSVGAFKKAKTVLLYVSSRSEVNTHDIIKEALKSKRVAVPLAGKNKTITACEIRDFNELGQGAFGIPEPKKEFIRPVDAKSLDLVIIPGIAFDKNGNRIGYGHGYFDRFLKGVAATKIALAYEEQIVEEIPAVKDDVPVDLIVTEKRIIGC